VRAVAWSPDGAALVTGGKDGALLRWELTHPDEPRLLGQCAGWVTAVAWHPVAPLVVSGDSKGELSGQDASSAARSWVRHLHIARVTALAWARDGSELASAAADGTILILGTPVRAEAQRKGAWHILKVMKLAHAGRMGRLEHPAVG
jgi:WD40 repeat protein